MYIVLFVVVLLNALVFLDQTFLPVALTTIQKEFHSSETSLSLGYNFNRKSSF